MYQDIRLDGDRLEKLRVLFSVDSAQIWVPSLAAVPPRPRRSRSSIIPLVKLIPNGRLRSLQSVIMNGVLFTIDELDTLRVSNSGVKCLYTIGNAGDEAYGFGTIKRIYQVYFEYPPNESGDSVESKLTRVALECKWYSPVDSNVSSQLLTGREHCVRFDTNSPWQNEPFILLSQVHPVNVLFWPSASDEKILHVIDDDIQWA